MRQIKIENIKLETNRRIVAQIHIDGQAEEIYAEVSDNVSQYLSCDYADPFIMGLMYFAMYHEYDIESVIPVSEELYYNLENHFIDTLANDTTHLYRVHIHAPIVQGPPKIGNIIATGISCGIDSLYTIYNHFKSKYTTYNISHLAFYNVGSHNTGAGAEKDKLLYEGRYSICKAFAEEYGYIFYTIDSNIHAIINKYGQYSHICNHSYMSAFCVLLLQKGIKRYYYSAGYLYNDFCINFDFHKTEVDSAFYDLLTFFVCSVNSTHIYSSGGNVTRIDKTKALCKFEPTKKYLNVCVHDAHNDSRCFKCIRTMLSIDAVGSIDDFSHVFDVPYYKKHKHEFIQEMWFGAVFHKDELYKEILPYYQKEITLIFKIKTIIIKLNHIIRNRLRVR